jgi:hypothetical protein
MHRPGGRPPNRSEAENRTETLRLSARPVTFRRLPDARHIGCHVVAGVAPRDSLPDENVTTFIDRG